MCYLFCGSSENLTEGAQEFVTSQGKLVLASEGRVIAQAGDLNRFAVTGAETNGKYAVWEAIVPPGGGPPLHEHSREEEAFYILEGEVACQVGERQILAAAGSFVHLPMGIPHRFRNESNTTARILITVVPAGLENMFFETGVELPVGTQEVPPQSVEQRQAEAARILQAAPKYGIRFVKSANSGGMG